MKILTIQGSHRKGNTLAATNAFIEAMKAKSDQEIEVETVYVKDLDLTMCTSCHQCFMQGEDRCTEQDKLKETISKMQRADMWILTSPVYALQVSALMKNWIDHMAYYFHRPTFHDKYAVVLTTTAGAAHVSTAKYLKSVLESWGVGQVDLVPLRLLAIQWTDVSPKIHETIERAAGKSLKTLARGITCKPTAYRLFAFRMFQQMSLVSPQSADGVYWRQQGLATKHWFVEEDNPLWGRVISGFAKMIAKRAIKDEAN